MLSNTKYNARKRFGYEKRAMNRSLWCSNAVKGEIVNPDKYRSHMSFLAPRHHKVTANYQYPRPFGFQACAQPLLSSRKIEERAPL